MGHPVDFHKMHVRLCESCHLCGIALITFYVLLLLMLTLIYARADTEMKRRAIEKASSDIYEVNARSAVPDVLDDDTLKRLYGLR